MSASREVPPVSAPAPSVIPSPWKVAATRYGVDPIDLYAIALQESRRRRHDGGMRPWPWTLNSPRTGALYFDNYQAALQKLKSLIAAGETNIDVGLMGINWYFNGHRARNPEGLLEVSENILIAAQIYREHLDRFAQDRRKAIAHYHSATRVLGEPYATAVMTIADRLRVTTGVHLALTESSVQNAKEVEHGCAERGCRAPELTGAVAGK